MIRLKWGDSHSLPLSPYGQPSRENTFYTFPYCSTCTLFLDWLKVGWPRSGFVFSSIKGQELCSTRGRLRHLRTEYRLPILHISNRLTLGTHVHYITTYFYMFLYAIDPWFVSLFHLQWIFYYRLYIWSCWYPSMTMWPKSDTFCPPWPCAFVEVQTCHVKHKSYSQQHTVCKSCVCVELWNV